MPFFPADKQAAEAIAADRGKAGFAASIGLVRSDLWTDYAMTLAFNPASEGATANDESSTAVQAATERAIALGPHDARSWLLLARADARLDWLNRNRAGPLEMSYYTGSNETSLMPMRLSTVSQSEAINDPDLQNLVTNDLRIMLLRRPTMKPAIVAAYRDASPEGKRFLETAVEQIDPNFVAELHVPSAPH
jgi:hypothetical protein